MHRFFLICALILTLMSGLSSVFAAATVRAVLFYSPRCSHCHIVINEHLPPLQQRYGNQLQILMIDVDQAPGAALYREAIAFYTIPEARRGVPTMIIGNTVMVGSVEIPQRLPALVEALLASGGSDWPPLPGLADLLAAAPTNVPEPPMPSDTSKTPPFLRDLPANALAVVVLVSMLFTLIRAGMVWSRPGTSFTARHDRSIPLLAVGGMAVAGYLTFVETTGAQAICGPVGNCQAVQQSEFARIFGIVPVGAAGIVGYGAILTVWIAARGKAGAHIAPVLPILALTGVLFSIYLTFLEPFVIGATCLWCLTSAILMTILLWRSMPYRRRGAS
ncbi:MAG: vitamin K epoxide reductase family protein [Roseiflexus sp.]